MSFEIEELDDEEYAILNESSVPIISLEQYKYVEFWSDPCWSEPPGPMA